MNRLERPLFALLFSFSLALAGSGVFGGVVLAAAGTTGVEMSPISGDTDKPRRHFRLSDPRALAPREAQEIYAIVKPALAAGYTRADSGAPRGYQTWRRYNRTPYLSATHGNHYLNNYANETARAYGKFEAAGKLPLGSVIAKDSFSVTGTGGILLGPLFLMQKMPEGFNYASGNWRFTLIQPDGTLFGETNGRGSERVEYCIDCHLARESTDHLYFLPRAYRRDTE